MSEELYALNADDLLVVKEVVRAYRGGELIPPSMRQRRVLSTSPSVAIFGIAGSGIAATTDDLADAQSGTVDLYDLSSTGGTSANGQQQTVWNLSSVALTSGEYTIAVKDRTSSRWLAIPSRQVGYKPVFRFVLDAALGTTAGTVAGKITHQYGPGTAHSTTGTVTLINLLTSTGGYLFEGTSGAAGLAYYGSSTGSPIVQLECP